MQGEYTITAKVSREDARKFLAELATNDELRARIEENAHEELSNLGLEVSPTLIPDTVRLPPKKEIVHLLYAADSAVETASPFGLLILFVVLGAMPMTTAGDGAG
jgi:hypothetical protein